MSATFEININGIRTGTVGNLTNVIRKVEFTVNGTEQGQTFALPQTVDLSDPQAESFTPLAQVTEANVVAWIEENFTNMDGVKAHIQMVLDKEVAKAALESAPLPWAPAVEPAPAPAA
jgi:glyoxylate utilization-related uncharacterized protein